VLSARVQNLLCRCWAGRGKVVGEGDWTGHRVEVELP
jgi:hypothetical protein